MTEVPPLKCGLGLVAILYVSVLGLGLARYDLIDNPKSGVRVNDN